MATTTIGSDRPNTRALETYPDAVFVRDDRKLYLGTGGDFSIEYDENGNDVALTAGADLRISDTQQLQFGDSGDFTITHDGTDTVFNGSPTFRGGDIKLSDSSALQLGDGADTTIWYDAVSDTSWASGRSIRTSDNFQIQFGNESDAILRYNAASDCFHLSGKTIKIGITSDLILVGLATSATGVVSGGLFASDATGTPIRIAT